MSVAYQKWVQQFVDVLSPVAVKTFFGPANPIKILYFLAGRIELETRITRRILMKTAPRNFPF